jgi:hypothetical protein
MAARTEKPDLILLDINFPPSASAATGDARPKSCVLSRREITKKVDYFAGFVV